MHLWRIESRTGLLACSSFLALSTASLAALGSDAEVGFDLNTGLFSAPIPYMKVVQVDVDAPDRTVLTVQYWRRHGAEACREAELESARKPDSGRHLVELAAVPAADPSNGRRKYVAQVGPLSVGYDYCFHFSAEQRAPLSDDQVTAITQTIFDSVNTKVLELIGTTPEDQSLADGDTYVPGIINSAKAALAGLVGLADVYDGPGAQAEPIANIVADRYLQDPQLRRILGSAVNQLFTAYRTLKFSEANTLLGSVSPHFADLRTNP